MVALRMSLAERQERWQACWRAIDGATPVNWGRHFLATLLRVGNGTPANTIAALANVVRLHGAIAAPG